MLGECYKYLGLEVDPTKCRAEPGRALAALVRDLVNQRHPERIRPRNQEVREEGATRVGHAGLGVPQLRMKVPAMKRGILERLAKSSDARVARIAEAILLPPGPSAKEIKEQAARDNEHQLYTSADGRGLSGCGSSPPTHEWVGDGSRLMQGSTYVHAIKTHLGVVNTRMRASRGRLGTPVLCDLGCGRPESLGHLLQSCPSSPVKSYRCFVNSLLEHGLWSGSLTLSRAHGLKCSYYDVGDIRAWVRERTGHTPVFTTLTINWRGLMSTPSYMALKSLGLIKPELRLLPVRAMEGSVATLWAHRDMGGSG
ncbi:Retrovirus-related Pol polyprotein from type-2 retrotransposable element R2DM [Portunus trituberculatus]|uniref:Retrovirus-related Pol polyprotein from type-2 retrotransposable element R2DM n=1 Tax=Portunus trituberculatus TaxID=210409 RepID=A0A5B7EQZ8_PORTR|nr:Retrovirus-related Pol polyprotein from type-2 retrotransposable element R2DM [Portunus trituberculatus]